MKVKKSTKKFIKNKLKDTLARRNEKKKFKKQVKVESSDDDSEASQQDEPENVFFTNEAEENISEDLDEPDLEEINDSELEGEDSDFEDAETYKQQMEKLKEKDPAFYKYLEKNSSQLLDISDEETENIVENENVSALTIENIKSWNLSIQKKSLKSLKKLLLALKEVACDMENASIDNSVFNLLLVSALQNSTNLFLHHMYKEDERVKGLHSMGKNWRKVQPLVRHFLISITELLKNMNDSSILKFILNSAEDSTSFFVCFPKLAKEYLKALISRWSGHDEESIRILSFLAIRKLAVEAPNPFIDATIKACQKSYLELCKFVNPYISVQVQFMLNSIVELCGLHLPSTYQHMFVFLRQMAVNLRTASASSSKDSYRSVYNWTFLSGVRLWTRVICVHCEKSTSSTLYPLIFPLVQIITGSVRLKPSARNFPFRFHLLDCLLQITQITGTYIPISSYLLEIFESAELKKKPKPSTLKPLDFTFSLHAPNAYLGTSTYFKGLLEQAVNQFFQFYASVSRSVAFPEICVTTTVFLRRLMKSHIDLNMSKSVKVLVEKLEQNAAFIESHRSKLSISPSNFSAMNEFLANSETPLIKYDESRKNVIERQPAQDMLIANESEEEANDEDSNQENNVMEEDKLDDYAFSDDEQQQ